MTPREQIAEASPEALLADGFDEALLGYTTGIGPSVAVYDYGKCVEILMADGMTEEEAAEYLDFNTTSAYVGEFTPKFVVRTDK